MSTGFGDIIHLNVGGKRFSTSRQTLTWIPDTFFTAILSGRISTLQDENGAIFIDRDPSLFKPILNYLRTKDINIQGSEEYLRELKHEAEFYAIMPLVRRLTLCEDLNYSSCGNLLFCGCLNPPSIPLPEGKKVDSDIHQNHSRHSSLDLRLDAGGPDEGRNTLPRNHSRSSSLDMRWNSVRLSGSSQNQLAAWFGGLHVRSMVDPLRVNIIRAHHNWILIAYAHAITCYKFKDSSGWQLVFVSPYMEAPIDRAALNARLGTTQSQNAAAQAQGPEASSKMVAFASKAVIRLWSISEEGTQNDIGTFNMHAPVESLFFIGSQLVALSKAPIGKIGVWHSMTQHWQIQDVTPVTSYDTAGSFLLLGCSNGAICYIDMQKFPLRMKDNDLLVTELYRDPSQDAITAISVYLTPKTRMTGNWIEIAYGTSSGTVRVIVQHPETVGHGPQLFQTFTVHRSPVTKVRLSEKYLVSVCSEYNHVRTWSVTRFRGMISTQPGSTPMASFKILALDEAETAAGLYAPHNDCGPYGEQDEEQLFVQKVVPDTDQLFVRFASNGKRVCSIKSVDGTMITSLCVHECEGSSRMGSRPRRILFTGHSNGIVQIWDLSTALDLATKGEPATRMVGGPTSSELLRLLDHCDVVASAGTTPASTPTPAGASALNSAGARVKTSNLAILSQFQRNRSSSDRT